MARASAWVLCGVVVAAGVACGGALAGYSGAPIRGRVVDAATGAPLPGVIVVARWHLESWLHGEDAGNLLLTETQTDADGVYAFAGWGPRRTAPGRALERRAPRLYFFKPGYAVRQLANDDTAPAPSGSDPGTSRPQAGARWERRSEGRLRRP